MHSPPDKLKFTTKLLQLIETEDVTRLTELLSKASIQLEAKELEEWLNGHCKNQWNPLHLSALKLNPDLLTLILDHGGDPDILDGDGNSVILLVLRRIEICQCQSCSRKAVQCINILGDFQADLGVKDKAGFSPLYLAAEFQSLECASALLRNGAPLQHRVPHQCRIFHHNEESMLKLLLQKLPSIVIDVFDRAVMIVNSKKGIHDPDCEVSIDLSVILPSKVMDFYYNNGGARTSVKDESNDVNVNIASSDVAEEPSIPSLSIKKTSILTSITNSASTTIPNQIHPIQDLGNLKSKIKNELSSKRSSIRKSFEWNNETRAKYKPQREMGHLNDLLESSHSDYKTERAILRHPLVTVFTDVKWRSLELMFLYFIIMQIVVLVTFTSFICITIFIDCPYKLYEDVRSGLIHVGGENINAYLGIKDIPTAEKLCDIQVAGKASSGFVLSCVIAVLIKEFQHAILDFKEYLRDPLNYIQLLGMTSIIATIAIAWDSNASYYQWFYPTASFAVAISWCQIFIQIGRFPRLAIYVDMLAKILVNFCLSLLIYSFILIGFAMSYCILFPTKPSLIDIPQGFVRILTMMVGELDYAGLFEDFKPHTNVNGTGNDSFVFSMSNIIAANIWYVCCVIVVTLVLMNLLVGLAVSDIQGCKNHAEIHVMKRRIRYTAYLEKSYYFMTHFLPPFLKDYLRKKIAIIKPPNEHTLSCFQFHKISLNNCCMIVRPNDRKPGILSQESKHAVKHWLSHRPSDKKTKQMCKFGRDKPKHDNYFEDKSNSEGGKSGDSINSPQNESRSITTHNLSIQRIERKLVDLDHKLDSLLERFSRTAHSRHD